MERLWGEAMIFCNMPTMPSLDPSGAMYVPSSTFEATVVLHNRKKSYYNYLERMGVPFVSLNISDNGFLVPLTGVPSLYIYYICRCDISLPHSQSLLDLVLQDSETSSDVSHAEIGSSCKYTIRDTSNSHGGMRKGGCR